MPSGDQHVGLQVLGWKDTRKLSQFGVWFTNPFKLYSLMSCIANIWALMPICWAVFWPTYTDKKK
eukprot:2566047-Amphidinium_carterae.1